jgi:hypothetical protein
MTTARDRRTVPQDRRPLRLLHSQIRVAELAGDVEGARALLARAPDEYRAVHALVWLAARVCADVYAPAQVDEPSTRSDPAEQWIASCLALGIEPEGALDDGGDGDEDSDEDAPSLVLGDPAAFLSDPTVERVAALTEADLLSIATDWLLRDRVQTWIVCQQVHPIPPWVRARELVVLELRWRIARGQVHESCEHRMNEFSPSARKQAEQAQREAEALALLRAGMKPTTVVRLTGVTKLYVARARGLARPERSPRSGGSPLVRFHSTALSACGAL